MEARGLAEDKKNAARLRAHLVFLDESGFLLLPTVRKTWAPRGRTPVVRHRFQRDKVSAISAVTVSPGRRRLGLYFQLHLKSLGQREVSAFLRHLLRHLKGAVIVLWDNGGAHKGDRTRALRARVRRLRIEWLPPYAPELNPDEGVWAQAKRMLSNGGPRDREDLRDSLAAALDGLRRSQSRLRGCVLQSDLPPLLP